MTDFTKTKINIKINSNAKTKTRPKDIVLSYSYYWLLYYWSNKWMTTDLEWEILKKKYLDTI